jgi:hypothetical protein
MVRNSSPAGAGRPGWAAFHRSEHVGFLFFDASFRQKEKAPMRAKNITVRIFRFILLSAASVMWQSWKLPQGTAVKEKGPRSDRFTADYSTSDKSGEGWSGRLDSNQRPYGPEPYALPNCATPRPRTQILAQFARSIKDHQALRRNYFIRKSLAASCIRD